MPLARAGERELACVFTKIDNRKTRRILHEANLDLQKVDIEIASKYIPRDRRFERIQVMSRLRAKLEDRRKSRS